jgi:hypothetical protein
MWFHKSKQPTQFAKSMTKFLDASEKVAIVAGVGVGMAALVTADVYLQATDNCSDDGEHRHRHRK